MTRKLDALVETHVFEKNVEWFISNIIGKPTPYAVDESAIRTSDYSTQARYLGAYWERLATITGDEKEFFGYIVPCRSTSIAAAWQVVEKLWEMNRILSLVYNPISKKWCVDFELWENDKEILDELVWIEHAMATMAICIAALKAVGVDQSVIEDALNEKAPG